MNDDLAGDNGGRQGQANRRLKAEEIVDTHVARITTSRIERCLHLRMAVRLAVLMLAVCTTFLLSFAAAQDVPAYKVPPDGYNSPASISSELQDMASANDAMTLIQIAANATTRVILLKLP